MVLSDSISPGRHEDTSLSCWCCCWSQRVFMCICILFVGQVVFLTVASESVLTICAGLNC